MKDLYEVLKTSFGYSTFRPLQKEIIERTLEKKDSVVLMPTGGGKSICFQLSALCFEGMTLVISPLISLMKDQVQSLMANGIKAAYFNSSLSYEKEQEIINECLEGKVKLLYLSPERLASSQNEFLKELDIQFVAVDEAHCVSMWGHDFRPEYTQLKVFRDSLPDVPFMGLTATADKSVREDIEVQLGLRDAELFISSFNRENLSIDVRGQIPKKEKLKQICNLIEKDEEASGIIYCLSRKNTEEVSDYLEEKGYSVAYYHAGIPPEERERVQTEFINDSTKIIVATVAFGMGIDKSNVRWVVHYSLPKNLEGYYQEIGRAGRDGLPSETILYYNLQDFILYRRFAEEGAHSEMQKEKLNRMLQFSEAKSCRRKILLAYFGEFLEEDCQNCDVCANPPHHFEGTILAQKALSGIARMNEKEGITNLINVLRGSLNAQVLAYNKLKTYGVGKDVSFFNWRDYIIQLANQGLIEIMYNENSALKITKTGWEVLKSKRKVNLTKPTSSKEMTQKKTEKKVLFSDNEVSDDLLLVLKQLRTSIAKKRGVPPYVVFSDKSLKEMTVKRPVNQDDFLSISGVGDHKMEEYGELFMEVLREGKQSKKLPTTQITLALYEQGLSPENIAKKRELQPTTIFSHLATLYLADEITNLNPFVSEEIVEKVRLAFHKNEQKEELKPIFEELEGEISYGKIRLALAIINKG